MRLHGWVDQPEFYALADENGVTIIGHRRIAVAKELGIEPRIRIMDFRQFGTGDAADIEKLKLAVLSNIGGKGMTKKDRQLIVARLAGQEWTQISIAEALGVSRELIKKDQAELRERGDLVPGTKSRQGGPGKSRPKKSTKPATQLSPETKSDTTSEPEPAPSEAADSPPNQPWTGPSGTGWSTTPTTARHPRATLNSSRNPHPSTQSCGTSLRSGYATASGSPNG